MLYPRKAVKKKRNDFGFGDYDCGYKSQPSRMAFVQRVNFARGHRPRVQNARGYNIHTL